MAPTQVHGPRATLLLVLSLLALASKGHAARQMLQLQRGCGHVRHDAPTYEEYRKTHGKVYSLEETANREKYFNDAVKIIIEHNKRYIANTETFCMGLNQKSDMSPAEYEKERKSNLRVANRDQAFQGKGPQKKTSQDGSGKEADITASSAGGMVDWRKRGNTFPVQNQGQCGSCWAFSAAGAVATRASIASKTPPKAMSPQQLVSCASGPELNDAQPAGYNATALQTDEFNAGCDGGTMDLAFEYIIANGGIDSDKNYPYTGGAGVAQKCNTASQASHFATISGYENLTPFSRTAMVAALQDGPVSVAIAASAHPFQYYAGGVLSGVSTCGPQLDHGVLVVGFTKDAWIIQNSWSEAWGDRGFVYMDRSIGGNGTCLILEAASVPTGAARTTPSPRRKWRTKQCAEFRRKMERKGWNGKQYQKKLTRKGCQ